MLTLDQVSFARCHRPILNQVSLAIPAGEFTAILGANGAGKSTLLSLLSGELTPQHGHVRWAGQDVREFDSQQLARVRAVLPQNPGLGFNLSVDEVIAMGAYPFAELSPSTVAEVAHAAQQWADVSHLTGRRYPTLSGGEQQRVQFARVLVQALAAQQVGEYRCVLLDEPTSSLDPLHQHGLLAAAQKLTREAGIAVVAVLHDVNLAARYCSRIAMLAKGDIIASGIPQDVLTPEHLQQTYQLAATVITHPQDPQRPLVLFDG
ncbi:heme ABC transporter ATP-binding protein [Deefgea piscis]|uniref:Heme ABC transporter ATP-binding protein n=1 Tax=Deefgea piscis TaxID=2739061 RepID=A0A6M8SNQ2_9NEIS|nr:heme ABC transporter ATP-binding protein [Deefgea piscis]QKJ66892.1 heme ABC transporter ATP-binding protein [Deefgea piscis]